MNKTCTKCGIEKDISEFYKSKPSRCKECVRKNVMKYAENHKEHKRLYNKQHRLQTIDIRKQKDKKYHESHKSSRNEYTKLWRLKHKEQVRQNRVKYAERHKRNSRWRLTKEYYSWSTNVYKNANHTCQHCGTRGKMNAHHIKPAKDFPDLRYDVSNGVCLCVECHNKIHYGS